ncbi:MAG: N-acetylmuramoyl-L-alanine amidase, partial [Terriglobia bacterium]
HDAYVQEIRFDDHDGRPKLIITPTELGLNFYSQLTAGQQTLVADLVKPAQAPGPQAPPERQAAAVPSRAKPGAASAPSVAASAPEPVQIPTAVALPAIVLDAGHGGSDSGARSRDGVLEKNVTAAIVRKLASMLQATGKYRIVLTRSGDSDPSFEQRSVAANTVRPVAFVSFHAGELGGRSPVIAVYTYRPSSAPAGASAGSPLFIAWNQVQELEQTPSNQLAQILEKHFSQMAGVVLPPLARAPVRQLRSIAAPAAAVETGTLSPAEDAGLIAEDGFEQQVASAAAAALEQFSGAPAPP